jgi:competence protein ComEC
MVRMASQASAPDAELSSAGEIAALQHNPWRSLSRLSSILSKVEDFLARSGHDRAPWLAVAFAAGIMAWFALDNHWQWLGLIALCGAVALAVLAACGRDEAFPFVRQSALLLALAVATGCGAVWAKSAMVGAAPISGPIIAQITGVVLDREDRPSESRVRLLLATREPESARAIRVRVNVRAEHELPGLERGAKVQLRARLVPPSPPLLPGGI